MAADRPIRYKKAVTDPRRSLQESLRSHRARLPQAVRRTAGRTAERDVHRLRVLTRRLRALVRLAKGDGSSAAVRRAGRRLRSLGRTLGERRAWDVAFANFAEFGLSPSRFRMPRAAATRRLRRELAAVDLGALREDLKKAARVLRAAPPARLARRVRRLHEAIAVTSPLPPRRADVRHAARIRFKKARYLLEACGLAARAAERLQTLLGREHDLHELQRLAGRKSAVQAALREARAQSDAAWASSRRATLAALARLEGAWSP